PNSATPDACAPIAEPAFELLGSLGRSLAEANPPGPRRGCRSEPSRAGSARSLHARSVWQKPQVSESAQVSARFWAGRDAVVDARAPTLRVPWARTESPPESRQAKPSMEGGGCGSTKELAGHEKGSGFSSMNGDPIPPEGRSNLISSGWLS